MWSYFDDDVFPENARKVIIKWNDETETKNKWYTGMWFIMNMNSDEVRAIAWKYYEG